MGIEKVVKIVEVGCNGDLLCNSDIEKEDLVLEILVKIVKWIDYFSWDEYFMVVVFFFV